ncbi:WbqC family protein [Cohnella sp. AR92]|uniref:WbqC family protein n=1 Tax=Cohnella sp. AR92 TaxID=648716 RepID=UPI002101D2D9|nr:WbqC family protein [Cohnella sp. AR92]
MQPTYLPWAGYFHLMSTVDTFVFLDDVQFARRSWQQRNRIVLQGREAFLTVPVMSRGKQEQLIYDVVTDETQAWRQEHILKLRHAYGKHPYGNEIIHLIERCYQESGSKLCELNINIISAIKHALHMNAKLLRSSELSADGTKSAYLINICKSVGASHYVSAPGSRQYIEEEALFAVEPLELSYHMFQPFLYPQRNATEFIPYMSIIDLISNVGFERAREYLLESSHVS